MARTIGDVESHGPLIEAIAKDCAANRTEIAKVDKRLDKTNVLLSNLSFEVGAQRQHLAIMSGDIADIRDVVESMNLRVVKIECEASELTTRVTGLAAGQHEANSRLDRMEATQMKHDEMLAKVLAGVERLEQKSGAN